MPVFAILGGLPLTSDLRVCDGLLGLGVGALLCNLGSRRRPRFLREAESAAAGLKLVCLR